MLLKIEIIRNILKYKHTTKHTTKHNLQMDTITKNTVINKVNKVNGINKINTNEIEQHIDPWTVMAGSKGFNYFKLLNQFGTKPITPQLIARIEKITNMRVHRFLRRGIFFSQQYLEEFLDHYESGHTCFLYTGRGPSSESMHLGHIIPFEFTKYLQEAFGCVLVIQISDDEKFYFKGGNLDNYIKFGRENAKNIICLGFDTNKTYIFSNFNEIGRGNLGLWKNNVEMSSFVSVNQIRSIFGLNQLSLFCDDNGNNKCTATPCSIAMMSWPIYQSIPCLSSSFNFIFGNNKNNQNNQDSQDNQYNKDNKDNKDNEVSEDNNKKIFCLVPMAIDQAPYFRLVNDYCGHKKILKPAQMHSEFLIGLGGKNTKMSSTVENNEFKPIFLTDSKELVREKIKKCFSGGLNTKKEHLEFGADLTEDVAYQWLSLFLESDEELEKIAVKYGPPKKNNDTRMMTSEIKNILADIIVDYLEDFQSKLNTITDETIDSFFNPNKKFDLTRPIREPLEELSPEIYNKQGCNFDRYFGLY